MLSLSNEEKLGRDSMSPGESASRKRGRGRLHGHLFGVFMIEESGSWKTTISEKDRSHRLVVSDQCAGKRSRYAQLHSGRTARASTTRMSCLDRREAPAGRSTT